jgi:hypothetical protein
MTAIRGLLVAVLLAGCSHVQLKTVNSIYEGLHRIRMSLESIPGVKPLADTALPWAPGIRLGLDTAYGVKHSLLPDDLAAQLGLTQTVEVQP